MAEVEVLALDGNLDAGALRQIERAEQVNGLSDVVEPLPASM